MQLAARKAEEPGDDIVSTLIDSEADGQLTEAEFGMFVVTLTVAGNETTRNSITQGMMAFTDFPDQWELFKAQRPKTAADEIIRWASPITAFQRTALADTELGGVQIKKGQRLVLFYRSANFDEDVFDDPFTFNILRDPNPHLGFGGTGAHYCVGANLARMTIDLMFNAIADHIPDLTPVSAPERLRSSMINGIKHWQVDYRRRAQTAGKSIDESSASERIFRSEAGTAGSASWRRSHCSMGSGMGSSGLPGAIDAQLFGAGCPAKRSLIQSMAFISQNPTAEV